jgi:hypothetical protein
LLVLILGGLGFGGVVGGEHVVVVVVVNWESMIMPMY